MSDTPLTADELDGLRRLWNEVVAARIEQDDIQRRELSAAFAMRTARVAKAEDRAADALPRLLATIDAQRDEIERLQRDLYIVNGKPWYEEGAGDE